MHETVDAFSRKDLWLRRWLPLLAQRAAGAVVVSGHPQIEPGYFMVGGEPKRFFDRAAVARLFADGWRTIGLEEHTIDRYERPKTAWEAVLEPA